MHPLLEAVGGWIRDADHHLLDAPERLVFHATLQHGDIEITVIPFEAYRLQLRARLPVRAHRRHREAVADFLHRLNRTLNYVYWILDPDDGAIQCRHATELPAPVHDAETRFRRELGRLIIGVDGMLPAILGVCGGGLRPETAVDQAHAHLAAIFNAKPDTGEPA